MSSTNSKINRIIRLFITGWALFFALPAHAQSISGRVLDERTGEPLPFVNIVYNANQEGTVTNIDGYFTIPSAKVEYLRASYMGYRTQYLDKQHLLKKPLLIRLLPAEIQLEAVNIFPGKNPAETIMEKVLRNRKKNDPDELNGYRYTAYHRFWVTAESTNKTSLAADTTSIRLLKRSQKQHLFLMETISRKNVEKPEREHEEILQSRVSGIQNPSFMVLATQLQSFSVYRNQFQLLDQEFLSPLSRNAIRNYLFLLRDTLYSPEGDSLFVISFQPRKNRNFNGMTGTLHINSNGYAVETFLSRPAQIQKGTPEINILQKYNRLPDGHWFPLELDTELKFRMSELPGSKSSDSTLNKLLLVGKSRTYLMQREINPAFTKKDFPKNAVTYSGVNQPLPTDVKQFRERHTSPLDAETYRVIDSLGRASHLEEKLQNFKSLIDGQVPLGPIDWDWKRLVNYNDYEGFKPGLGLETNSKLSRYFSVGGYATYGFQDRKIRHGEWFNLFPSGYRDLRLQLGYHDENLEIGGNDFLEKRDLLQPEFFRDLLIRHMYATRRYSAKFLFRPLQTLKLQLTADASDNRFSIIGADSIQKYKLSRIGLQLRFAPGEKTYKAPDGLYTFKPASSEWFVNAYRGVHWFDGPYSFTKLEMKGRMKFMLTPSGPTRVMVKAGNVTGDVPYPELFNGNGSYTSSFTLLAPYSFATMRMNEFTANQYASIFIRQSLGKMFMHRNTSFHPEILVVQHAGVGKLDDKYQNAYQLSPSDFRKGYFESGFEVDNLLPSGLLSYGLGVYYRYGPYALPTASDNWAFKIGMFLNFQKQ
ncbi:membrane protein [Prolixibacter bellariivorans]|uniref:Membrane protein n=1 Tax=Prolixibacter bellariivorans TaxID=314319 RepID=A0A5M4AWQ0_9BACT|nr:DUF5686 and carboxypeptidase-like regulatory domain-containing protein [Prolixibacter bellariivorans]GET32349.1 membrane protein [Prolixibacter bellariivorans]